MYDERQIERIYCESDYEENPYFSYELTTVEEESAARFRNYRRALARVESITGAGRVLDVGCGSGTFLYLCKKRGWRVSGVEISEPLAQRCREAVGAEVLTGRFEDLELPESGFDLVSLWDVIEHVIDPVSVMRRVRELLRPGGVALYCTPDEDSLLARTGRLLYLSSGGRYSYPALALHPPNHTYFFSRRGFRRIVDGLGLQPLADWSQTAFFEHSEMASTIQKAGIALIEGLAGLADRRYEMVVLARRERGTGGPDPQAPRAASGPPPR